MGTESPFMKLLSNRRSAKLNQEFWFRARKQFVSDRRVHEDHEQIFDDAMDQKATVTKEVY